MGVKQIHEVVGRLGTMIEHYSKFTPVSLSLKSLLIFGETAPASKSFDFLKYELPVRFANIIREIQLLPNVLKKSKPIKHICLLYEETFDTLLKYEGCSTHPTSTVSRFTDDIDILLQKHSSVVEVIALGIKEIQNCDSWSEYQELQLQYFLDRFYVSRIGVRTLMNQHSMLYGPTLCNIQSHVGSIDPDRSPLQIAINAYSYSRSLCMQVYGRAPGCDIEVYNCVDKGSASGSFNKIDFCVDATGHPSTKSYLLENQMNCADLSVKGKDVTFCYVPGHLFYIMYELLKNSMRAVIEKHTNDAHLPRLHVFICNANEDIVIKITDFGGGMALNVVEKTFRYNYTTAVHSRNLQPAVLNFEKNHSVNQVTLNDRMTYEVKSEHNDSSSIAGRGHGLPLSRLYARYFGGDLHLYSVEGVGTSALIYLKRQPQDAHELIPLFNHTSRSVYENNSQQRDWVSNSHKTLLEPSITS
uniref:Protein-serine/threonine kinase n=1 Tax=Schistosoma japonicum TaxID=6182 RepID=Q5DDA1_SCHJA|nr:SJCHGC06178 protein [Schistosoma japonicum]